MPQILHIPAITETEVLISESGEPGRVSDTENVLLSSQDTTGQSYMAQCSRGDGALV